MEKQAKKMNSVDASLMASGAIIGAGIFSMTGIAVGAAGPGVPIAFIIAGLCSMLMCLPHMIVSSAIPAKGGRYLYVARFLSPLLGFLQIWNTVIQVALVSVMGLSAGQYLPQIFPMLTPKTAGVLVVAAIVVACLFNVRTSARVQNIMVILILISLVLFIAMGIPHIKYWSLKASFSVSGISGILLAVSYVRSSAWGAIAVVNLGGEIENPGKAVPRSIATATLSVSLIYALVGIVAIGVVPWEQMIHQPLSVPAKEFMPGWALSFFVLGGALFAVCTTLLSLLMDFSRAIWAAAGDGLFPQWLRATNKHGVPYRILLLMGAAGAIPIILDLSIGYVFAVMSAPAMLLNVLDTFPAIVARKKLPDRFEKAWFRMPVWMTWAAVLLNMGLSILFSYKLFTTLDAMTIMWIVLFYGTGVAYYYIRVKDMKKKGVDLVKQMTAYDPAWLEE
ncbi:APC family permease [Bacilliculturomica massiliensis]|uniref:APC family permease n=1 Tax=Bacilliculturomica massiliensis TaxID=1917867 RepID=UPI0010302F95|nr:APC family permease [Bacilliculturomica massiliensis]